MKNSIQIILIIYTLLSPFLMPLLNISVFYVWPAILAGLIASIILHFNEIKSLSVNKLKIEMRDKLNEAQAIISSLKTFTTALTEHTLTDLMAGCFGFQGGMGRYKRFELKEKIIETLKKMGFNDNEIEEIEIRSHWRKGVRMIYWNAIQHALEKRTEDNHINPQEPERRKASEALSSRMTKDKNDFTEWDVPSAEEIKKVILEQNITIGAPLQDWLNDYSHYLLTGEIKRRNELLK